ncbi:MAG TPA: hypothetical protein VFN23_13835, partial [Ktedonobacteraceae bacterium]|nr:hypothetical protein [Ktedonobacteraceae bacterium]
GPRLLVEAYTPSSVISLEFNVIQNRPLDEVFEHFWQDGTDMVNLAHQAYKHNEKQAVTKSIEEGSDIRRHVVYMFVPSHDASGRVSGVMIYSVDETERFIKEVEEMQ